jgi:amino acid efflux transporter
VGARQSLGVLRGGALYVGALIGPGLLLVPALAARAAGAASIVAWAALLVLSAPLAITFGALGVRHPVAGGVSAYVREGLGAAAAAVTGVWFLTAVLLGAPAVSLIGGYYVADLTGSGTVVAALVGLGMFGTVLSANVFGLRVSSGFQLVLSSVLIVVMAVAITVALPAHAGDNWTPFAPHGWWAVGTAANILVWLFVGWEAVAQLAGDFRRPATDLPRAMGLAFGVVTVLYVGLALATIGVTVGTDSRVPLADLVSVGFGRAGRDATAVLAVALTMGTMNVYLAGAAKLSAALARSGALPAWLAGGAGRSVPRRPLAVLALAGRRCSPGSSWAWAARARSSAPPRRSSSPSTCSRCSRRSGSSTGACASRRPQPSPPPSCSRRSRGGSSPSRWEPPSPRSVSAAWRVRQRDLARAALVSCSGRRPRASRRSSSDKGRGTVYQTSRAKRSRWTP